MVAETLGGRMFIGHLSDNGRVKIDSGWAENTELIKQLRMIEMWLEELRIEHDELLEAIGNGCI